MKKIGFLLLFICLQTSFLWAQRNGTSYWDYYYDMKAHEKGQIHFFYGYGGPRLDQKLFQYHKNEMDFRVVNVGPFIFKTEYGLSRKLSVALSTTYTLYKSDWNRKKLDFFTGDSLLYQYKTTFHDISANLRLNYHLYVSPHLDVYIGGGTGYNYSWHKDTSQYYPKDSVFNAQFKNPPPISAECSIGAKYFFLTRNAFFVELGYGKSLVQAGFVFKFRQRKRE
jgi:hypothetical protein